MGPSPWSIKTVNIIHHEQQPLKCLTRHTAPVVAIGNFMKMEQTPTHATHEPRTGRPRGDQQEQEDTKTVTTICLGDPYGIGACRTRRFQSSVRGTLEFGGSESIRSAAKAL